MSVDALTFTGKYELLVQILQVKNNKQRETYILTLIGLL